MFDEENLISLAIFLSFCQSVHNTYVQPWLWGYVFFAKFPLFREIFVLFFREIFALFFREIFALFFRETFAFFRETDWSETTFPFRWKPYNNLNNNPQNIRIFQLSLVWRDLDLTWIMTPEYYNISIKFSLT